jgi:hypothetical protein
MHLQQRPVDRFPEFATLGKQESVILQIKKIADDSHFSGRFIPGIIKNRGRIEKRDLTGSIRLNAFLFDTRIRNPESKVWWEKSTSSSLAWVMVMQENATWALPAIRSLKIPSILVS